MQLLFISDSQLFFILTKPGFSAVNMNSFILSLLLLVASAWCIEYEVELGRASIKLDQEKMQLPTYPTHSNTFQLTTQSTIPLSALSYYMKYYNTLNLESFRNMIGGICLSHVSWFGKCNQNLIKFSIV